ncbi:ParA family protein [Maricurvus nonylphenolicus]|uniref:nucleotide-binding protein n=1 Tax=Maricurvus nonylphenolicus TaxID=1008307 RepID=UPI0036F3BB3D
MKQIFVANPKGGCGKTTLATQIASYYAGQNQQVALVDHDNQQSSLDWLKCRPQGCAPIDPVKAYNGYNATVNGVDWSIHDMPAACSLDDLKDAIVGDAYLLIPILPSPTDIKAGVRFLMALNRDPWFAEANIKVGLVANRVRSNTNYFKVLVSFLEQVNMPLITSIRDTQNYIRAMDGGVGIFDLPPSRVVTDKEQWEPLLHWLSASP